MTTFEDIIKKAGQLGGETNREYSLSADERAKMSRVLREYMAHKPLRARQHYTMSISYSWFSFVHRPLAAALVLVLVSGTGISYAAENALPGDSLYAVKTHINEPVRIALASGAEAKATVQIELAERRIDEAATLAAEGRLDAQTQQDLAVAFESHAAAASDNIQKTDDTDSPAAAELASRFETRLAAHDEVLAQVEDQNSDHPLANAIQSAGRTIAVIRAQAEENAAVSANAEVAVALAPSTTTLSPVATNASAEGSPTEAAAEPTTTAAEAHISRAAAEHMRSAAQKQLDAVRKHVATAALVSDEQASAEARLAIAEELITTGNYEIDNSTARAFHSFQDSLVITGKMDVLLNAASTLAKAHSRFVRDSRGSDRGRGTNAASSKGTAPVRATTTVQITAPASVKVEMHNDSNTDVKVQNSLPPTIRIFPSDDEDGHHDSNEKNSEDVKIDISL